MPDFSVIICTYNGEHRLPKLLDCFRQQQISYKGNDERAFQWEVVVVDNNSSDRTADIIHNIQADIDARWHSDVPLRYYFEPKQGLAFARRCAVNNTQSPLLGFLDDDTLPEPNWVNAAFEFAQQHPQVGAYGSSIYGQYEVPPPPNFYRIACCLAIIDRGERAFQYSSERGVLPAGAGMVIRRQAWLEQVPEVGQLTGVCATSLKAKGEDVETLSYIRKAWPIWHNPAMKLHHVIPRQRLVPKYLQHLCWRIGISRYPLRRLNYRPWQWPLMVMMYFVSDLKKLLWKLACSWQVDTVTRCEFALLLGSLLSPFYHHSIPTSTTDSSASVSTNTISVTTESQSKLQSKPQITSPQTKAAVTAGRSSS